MFVCVPHALADEKPTTLVDYVELGVGYSNLAITDSPLSVDELSEWVRILNASEAQENYLRVMYHDFVTRHNAFMDEAAPRYLAKSAEISDMRPGPGEASPEFVAALEDFHQEGGRMQRRLARIELDLVDLLVPQLYEKQLPRLEILRNRATRRQMRTFPNLLRWSDVELSTHWYAIDPELISSEESEAIDLLLFDYETQLTRRYRRLHDAFWDRMLSIARSWNEVHLGKISLTERRQRYVSLLESKIDASVQVGRLNRRTLQTIQQMVSGDIAEVFTAHVMAAVFPEIYPDVTSLDDLFEALINDESIDSERRDTIMSTFQLYRLQADQINSELEKFCEDFARRGAEGDHRYLPQFFDDAFAEESQRRIDFAAEQVERLVEIVGEEVVLEDFASYIPPPVLARMSEDTTD
ncbi:MAG: hypothetical protein EA377_02615 [Phycisphaerales bacterium]|nr:MAG: hypothetical protein EA377_02615 [Phycisphaerales bacterium]